MSSSNFLPLNFKTQKGNINLYKYDNILPEMTVILLQKLKL
jgi:hypothetical protein